MRDLMEYANFCMEMLDEIHVPYSPVENFKSVSDFRKAGLAYAYYLRQVENITMIINEWANNAEDSIKSANWGDANSAAHVMDNLLNIAEFLGLDVKEV